MAETVSTSNFKKLVEKKLKKKILVKIMWNEEGKLTLFITPNMKINSFIHDEKEGYLFFDNKGNPVNYKIPCVLSQMELADGQIKLNGNLQINGDPLSETDMKFLKKEDTNGN